MTEQGETYSAFIEAELKAEHERRSELTASATSVVTASSGFIALVAAVLVFVTGKDYQFSEEGARGLLLSLLSFIVAAGLAMFASASREYDVPKATTLQAMTQSRWIDNEVDARNFCARLNATTLASLRTGSNKKAGLMVVAFCFQVAAILGVVVSIGWELRGFAF